MGRDIHNCYQKNIYLNYAFVESYHWWYYWNRFIMFLFYLAMKYIFFYYGPLCWNVVDTNCCPNNTGESLFWFQSKFVSSGLTNLNLGILGRYREHTGHTIYSEGTTLLNLSDKAYAKVLHRNLNFLSFTFRLNNSESPNPHVFSGPKVSPARIWTFTLGPPADSHRPFKMSAKR